jgi:hypothetical protein
MEDGSKDRYFQDVEDDVKKLVPEGISGRVPLRDWCLKYCTNSLADSKPEWDTAVPRI